MHTSARRRLSARELAVLRALVAAAPAPVSRQTLLVEALGYHKDSLSRAPDDAIRCLRGKIEQDPAAPVHILTVHGEGYRFAPLAAAPAAPPAAPPPEGIPLADRRLDLDHQRVLFDDGRIEALSAQECALLSLLVDVGGAAVPRAQLNRELWGQHSASDSRALDHAVTRLRQKLEVDPANPRLLLTQRGRGLRLALPSVRRAPLPPTPAPLIGRQQALAQLQQALGHSRLVTLLGPGGIGKTRLAVELARRASESGQAVVFCELEAARTEEALLAGVAAAMGAPDAAQGADPVARVGALLSAMQGGLLLLDNLEQVAGPAAAVIGRWLRAPGPAILATSRAPLRLSAEEPVEIGPLDADDAVALCQQRARGAWADAPRDTLLELVEHLDRSPLAIELAAARARLLGPAQLLRRLDDRLSLLQSAVDAPPRQRSLRDTIAWSWELLAAPERRALAWCSAFDGSFSARAWESLAPDGPNSSLDLLASLRDRSLVSLAPGPPGEARCRLLESIQAFAAEQLARSGEQAAAFDAHAAFFTAEGETLEAQARATGTPEATAELALEVKNLLAACDRSLPTAPARAARLLVAAARHLRDAGQLVALRSRLEPVAAALPAEERLLAAQLGFVQLSLALQDRAPGLRGRVEAALAEVRALREPRLEADLCLLLASLDEREGRLDEAVSALQAMRAAATRAGAVAAQGSAAAGLGVIRRRQGRLDAAEAAYREALALLGADGHFAMRATAHWYLGVLELRRCRFASSVHHLSQALGLAEAVGAHRTQVYSKINLGYALWMSGKAVRGEALLRDALGPIRALWPPQFYGVMEDALGRCLLLDGRVAEASRSLRQALDHLSPSPEQRQCGAFLAIADQRAGHPEEARGRLVAIRAEATTLGEVETLALLDALGGAAPSAPVTSLSLWQAAQLTAP